MEIVPAEEGPCDHDDAGSSSLSPEISSSSSLPEDQVQIMIDACWNGRMHIVQQCLAVNPLYARQQLHSTGQSPLMAAASSGNHALCLHLLEAGAPWNAVDRKGQCAGNYASDHNHQSVVDLLVEWAVRSELILGQIERSQRCTREEEEEQKEDEAPLLPIEHQSSTKPDYLRQRLQYTPDGRALLDADRDAVMMEWERPLMNAHAQILMEEESSLSSSSSTLDGGSTNPSTAVPPVVRVGKRVLNVGFGMGIVDTALQSWNPSLHIIIEAHPDVYNRMIHDKWDQKHNVRICFGKWQDVLPQLILEQVVVDGIFYDTYGEHYMDLEDFHMQMIHLLSKPHGIYSFFNGLAPDNVFFHGVACQCVQLQLAQLGLEGEFYPCEIQVKDEVWEGIRRQYWHGRDTYYLPRFTWNAHYLATGQILIPLDDGGESLVRKSTTDEEATSDATLKRQRF